MHQQAFRFYQKIINSNHLNGWIVHIKINNITLEKKIGCIIILCWHSALFIVTQQNKLDCLSKFLPRLFTPSAMQLFCRPQRQGVHTWMTATSWTYICVYIVELFWMDFFWLFSLICPFKSTEKSHLEMPLEENINRIIPEEGTVEARTIEDAIAVLRYHPLWRNTFLEWLGDFYSTNKMQICKKKYIHLWESQAPCGFLRFFKNVLNSVVSNLWW